jgi:hypothetical protein
MVAYSTPVLDFPPYIPSSLRHEFCIEDCIECMRACERCSASLLRGMPLNAMLVYRQMLFECGDLAMRTAKALAQGDPDALAFCAICADLCDAWAQECLPFEDESFQACAEALQRCAESCNEVLVNAT